MAISNTVALTASAVKEVIRLIYNAEALHGAGKGETKKAHVLSSLMNSLEVMANAPDIEKGVVAGIKAIAADLIDDLVKYLFRK